MKRKILALLLSLSMSLSSVSFSVFAEDVSSDSVELSESSDDSDVSSDVDSDSEINDDSEDLVDADIDNSDDVEITSDAEIENDDEDDDDLADSEVEDNSSDAVVDDGSDEQESIEDTSVDADSNSQSDNSDDGISLAALEGEWFHGSAGQSGADKYGKATVDLAASTIKLHDPTKDGKWTKNETKVSFVALKDGIDLSKNFKLSATMMIDGLAENSFKGPKQASAGMMIAMDPNDAATPNVSNAVGMFNDNSGRISGNCLRYIGDDGAYGIVVRDPSNTGTDLSDPFDVGKNIGPFELSIEKLGNVYTVKCGDNVTTIDYPAENFMGKNQDNNIIYPVFFGARDISATFTNVELFIDDREVDHIEIGNEASDNTAIFGNNPTLPDLVINVVYTDGSINPITTGYGFANYDPNKLGEQDIKIVVGESSVDYKVTVVKKVCTDLNITSLPVKIDYFEGQKFRTTNLIVSCAYDDGTSTDNLDKSLYDFYIDGKLIGDEDFITADFAGENKEVVVKHKDVYGIDPSTPADSFFINVSPYKYTGIKIQSEPAKLNYFIGEEFNPDGLIVRASYSSGSVSGAIDNLQPSEYYIQQLPDTNKLGKQTVVVVSKYDSTHTASFEINVVDKRLSRVYLTSYPRTTYNQIVDVPDSDYDPKEWYDKYNGTGTVDEGNKQYNMGNLEVTYLYTRGTTEIVGEDQYKINLDNFDIRKAGTSEETGNKIVIEFPEGSLAYGRPAITIPVTVLSEANKYDVNHWRGVVFGASSSPSKSNLETDKMGIIFYDPDGKETPFNTKDNKNEKTNIEEKGSSLRIWANQGAGKQADSNDGMSYYYTRLSTKNNFKLSADVVVNSYVQGDADENRDGQEGFGIMARDIGSFQPKEGYGFNYSYRIEDSLVDDEGEPIPKSTSSPYNYSNMVFIGGYSGSGWPSDPTASNYFFNSTKNRINLVYRTFVDTEPYSASSDVYRSDVTKTLSKDFPSPKHKFHLSLERINGGYKGICYDYQDGKFRTDYIYYDKEIGEKDLDQLDPDNIYVGFYASRYADITVSNVELIQSDPSTDMPVGTAEEKTKPVTPTVNLQSSIYSSTTDYNLVLRASNKSGGYAIVKQDDKVIYSNVFLAKRNSVLPVTLPENSSSKFTVLYTPRYIAEDDNDYEELTSYDDAVFSWTVSHKGNFDKTKEFIYVSPNGTAIALGTPEDPLDFDVALGMSIRGQKLILLPGYYKRKTQTKINESQSGTANYRRGLIGYDKYNAEEEGYAITDEQYDAYMDKYLRSILMNPDDSEETYQANLEKYKKDIAKVGVTIDDAVFDFQKKTTGIISAADYWDMKNFHVTNGPTNGKVFHIGGDYNLIDNVKAHDNQDSGICLSRIDSSQLTIEDWPKGNLFQYCEAWNNADASRNNADGFATKLTIGHGNKFINCVTHHNSDDGWDMFCKQSGGLIAPITIERCIAYKAGYQLVDATTGEEKNWDAERGGKNGFKMGGDTMPVNNVVVNCMAFENGQNGLTSNSNPLMTIRDYVGYKNEAGNISLYSESSLSPCIYDAKGVISYLPGAGDGIASSDVNPNADSKPYNYLAKGKGQPSMNSEGDVVDESFFESLDSPVVNGLIPQDPKTHEYQTGKFLKLSQKAEEKLAAAEGYEKYTEPVEDTTDDSGDDKVTETTTKSPYGSSSSKKGSSSSGGSSSNNKTDKTESNKTETNKTDTNKTETDKTDTNKTETDKTDTNKTETDNNIVVAPEVSENIEISNDNIKDGVINAKPENKDANSVEIKINKTETPVSSINLDSNNVVVFPKDGVFQNNDVSIKVKDAAVLPEAVQKQVGKNAAYIEISPDGGASVNNGDYWIGIPFYGDTSEYWKIVGVKISDNGTTTIIKPAFYDNDNRKLVMIPVSEPGNYGAVLSDIEFIDMENNWAKEYVETLASRNIVNGVGDNKFAPNEKITRGDFTKILVDIINVSPTSENNFTDINPSDYYSEAITAAKEKGLINGLSDTEFAPKDSILRQDMMVIIAKTLEAMGVQLNASDLSGFSDASSVSDYAKDSVSKLVNAGFISGDAGRIKPQDNLSRAEAAKVLYELWKIF